ncbi:hypothetical protein [Nannocystis punicea]|uniref:Uncharacterized protein n=1 Tax=Nannocystis punicea TaxID=2995304 RepID=A0ABY7HER9_9BACT|nr:hypothetical protein [Nannocystis poenicansa]WAS97777.1 hypothetical protein O0S08_16665 [Nannocystis poenicansa]
MSEPDRRDTRPAWRIHGLALAALVVLYFYVFSEVLFGPPRGGFDLSGFAAYASLILFVAYAIVTTFLMLWVGRRTWGPGVMHVLLAGGYIVAVVLDDRAAAARRAEIERRSAEERGQQVENCLAVELRAIRGAPPRAAIELYNGCEASLRIAGVDLVGFPPAGGSLFFESEERETTTLPPHQRATFLLRSTFSADAAVGDGWDWRFNLIVDAPESGIRCFTTPGASDSRCVPFRRVALDNR